MAIPASMPPQNAWSLRSSGRNGLGAGCAPAAAGGYWPPRESFFSFMAQSCHSDGAFSEHVTDAEAPRAAQNSAQAIRLGGSVKEVAVLENRCFPQA
jgi:hypothetical protein